MPKANQKTTSAKKTATSGGKTKHKKKLMSDKLKSNPWSYAETVPLLPETGKIDIKGLELLECRQQYQISLVKLENKIARDNELSHIFGTMVNQDARFMRQWIRVYVVTHRKTVNAMARDYLDGKGLTLQTWLSGLKEGRWADVLGLFLLCLATQTHCFVHLKNGYWSTLRDPPDNHLELIQRCNVHLSYLGRGISIEHVSRLNTSFEIFGVSEPVDMPSTSAIIGELSIKESEAVKTLLSLGTCVISETGGLALNPDIPTTSNMGNWEINPSKPTTPTSKKERLVSGISETSASTDTVTSLITQPSLPLPNIQSTTMEELPQPHDVAVIKEPTPELPMEATYASTSSVMNKKHGALSCEQILEILNNQPIIVLKRCPIPKKDKCPTRAETGIFPSHKTATQYKLRIQTHNLKRKCKWRYYFKCAAEGCSCGFSSVKEWNIHHLAKHKTVTYYCRECTKQLQMLTSMRSHELTCRNKPYSCGRCGKTFLHLSKLNLHRHFHRHQRLYSCCKRAYKWPQDLLRHIKKHLNVILKCKLCTYTTHEKRLLRQHSNIYTRKLPYKCRKCGIECFKHTMQCYRHKQKCLMST